MESRTSQIAQHPKLSVLVPVYNERRTLRKLLNRILSTDMGVSFEIIIVDDCSTDGSIEIIQDVASSDERVRAFYKKENSGKGAAIHAAIKQIRGEIAIVQDADLEYDPREIPKIIAPILEGKADVVFGSRFAGSEARRVLYFWHTVANLFLTFLTNMICDLNLTDMETCYKAVKTDILKKIRLQCRRFGLEPELTIRLAQWGAIIYEVPISYSGRTYAEGKKITWRDGYRALVAIFWFGFVDKRFTSHQGFYHLTSMRGAGLNSWKYSQFKQFVGNEVLEIGCGIGDQTSLMLEKRRLVSADIDPLYFQVINQRFGHLENFKALQMDISKDSDFQQIERCSMNTVVCLNVLEHIENDRQVLKNCFEVLKPGGHLIVLAPQHQSLFSPFDSAIGHCRRYSEDELFEKVQSSGLKVVLRQGFNRMGTFGWWINGQLLKRDTLSPFAMMLFHLMLPVAKLVERATFLPALSVIIVGEKPLTDPVPDQKQLV